MALTKISRSLLNTGVSDSSDATAITIDSSENVGIGVTSLSQKLEVNGNVGITDNLGVGTGSSSPNSRLQIKKDGTGNYANQTFTNANSTAGITFGIAGSGTGNYLANNAFLLNTGSSAFIFGTGDTERMRIDSDGNLLLGTTTRINNSNTITKTTDHVPLNLRRDNGASDNSILICVKSSNTAVLAIRGDGDLENTNNAYGALSDERLKSNIVDANSQLEDIKKVKVRNYTLDSTGETHIGVIAQELEESGMGGLVVKREEGYKGVKYSILFMKAIKAIQELTAKVEELESKIDG